MFTSLKVLHINRNCISEILLEPEHQIVNFREQIILQTEVLSVKQALFFNNKQLEA